MVGTLRIAHPTICRTVIARSESDEAIHISACRTMDCFASLAMTMWKLELRQNNPTGKSAKTCPAPLRKIFRFRRRANHRYDSRVSPVTRGVAHVTNARWDAVDADVTTDERD
jgi:hypothetical protein